MSTNQNSLSSSLNAETDTGIIENSDGSYSQISSFTAQGNKWNGGAYGTPGGIVTWSFAAFNLSDRLSYDFALNDWMRPIVEDALNAWQSVANIQFSEVADSSSANIRFGLNDIDGPSNTLGVAHTTWQGNTYTKADIELDSSESWTELSIYTTFLHEIGHAIGLGHEDRFPSILNTFVNSSVTNLTDDDIAGAVTIYGPSENYTAALSSDIPASTNTTAIAAIGADYEGTINFSSDIDWIKLNLVAGENYTIELKGAHTQDGSLVDPEILGMFDRFGSPLHFDTRDDNSGSGLNSSTQFAAYATSEYYVSVGSHIAPSTDGDTYTLSIEITPSQDIVYNNEHIGDQKIDYISYYSSYSGYSLLGGSQPKEFFISYFGGVDKLENIDRIEFSDTTVALDIEGNAGQAYRLYKAAFDREPDSFGLGYWINELDNGSSLLDISNSFIDSLEFQALYGSSPSDEEFIELLYSNVLDRTLDQSGFDYWVTDLNSGLTHAGALASFSESSENQSNLIGLISNGIQYEQWIA